MRYWGEDIGSGRILGKTLWLRVRARIYNEKVRKRISFSNCQNK